MLHPKRKGQSTLEYVLLITAIVAALVALSVLARRAIMGKIKDNSREVSEKQFDPNSFYHGYVNKSSEEPQVTREETTRVGDGGQQTTTIERAQTITTDTLETYEAPAGQ